MRCGIIGAGDVGTRIARHVLATGNEVVIANSRGPETLAGKVAELGPGAHAGTREEAAACEVVFLAVWWDRVPDALAGLPDWSGRVLVDATNQLHMTPEGPRPADASPLTGSEAVANMAPGARVVKAFNSLFGTYMDGKVGGGRRVLFYCGDDAGAKGRLGGLFDAMGFYPVDLGGLAQGGRLMQVGGALNGKHFVKLDGDRCL